MGSSISTQLNKSKQSNETRKSTTNSSTVDLEEYADEYWQGLKSNIPRKELSHILEQCLIRGKYSLLEWYCINEIYDTNYWTRQQFKNAFLNDKLVFASKMNLINIAKKTGKLSALRILASYTCPHIIEEDHFQLGLQQYTTYWPAKPTYAFSDTDGNFVTDIKSMIDEGKRENAYNVIRCRDGLNLIEWKKYDMEMPQEILTIIITYVAGDKTLKAIKKYRSLQQKK
eukprot:89868_1